MTNKKNTLVDKAYKLGGNAKPLSYMLPTKNTRRYPLMHFDEAKGINRALRYASNQRSPFEDEQDGNAILSPIIFEDGMLTVPRQNQVLQQFLDVHPLKNLQFFEVNKEKDAEADLDVLELELDALVEARGLSSDMIDIVGRVLFGAKAANLKTKELRRDIIIEARTRPQEFLNVLNDKELKMFAVIQQFFDEGLLSLRKHGTEVFVNLPTNKTRLVVIQKGDDLISAVHNKLVSSQEGEDLLKLLELASV